MLNIQKENRPKTPFIKRWQTHLIVSFSAMLLMIVLAAVPALAKGSFRLVSLYPNQDRVNVGGRYFWIEMTDSTTAAIFSGGNTGAGVNLTEYSYRSWSPWKQTFLTDGDMVYYVQKEGDSGRSSICSITADGSSQKNYGKYEDPHLVMKYSNRLYFSRNDLNYDRIYSLNLGTSKAKNVSKIRGYSYGYPANSRYIYIVSKKSKQASVSVFDMKKNKVVKTYKVAVDEDCEIKGLFASKKYFYFTACGYGADSIYRLPATGKSKPKKIASVKADDSNICMTDDKYVYYMSETSGKYYRYSISGKKSKKISSKVFEKKTLGY